MLLGFKAFFLLYLLKIRDGRETEAFQCGVGIKGDYLICLRHTVTPTFWD